MPRARPVPAVSADFDEIRQHLKTVRILSEDDDSEKINLIRRVHTYTYSLFSWHARLDTLPEHASPFIEEIASDAIQILPHLLLGYSKALKLLVRGILENSLRFVYFIDHPIEFKLMNTRDKWFISTDKLLDYMRNHPEYVEAGARFDSIQKLNNLYDDLSATIHGRRVRDLQLNSALAELKYSADRAQKDAKHVQQCAELVNFIVVIKMRDNFQKFSVENKRIILRTLPKLARSIWSEID